ncbi:MAG TPA: VOC family protein [Woeseiaceae bacterium]
MSNESTFEKQSGPLPARIDHLVLAAPDLELGIRYVQEQFGVDPIPGGNHPVYGTRNALVGLGEHCYLEIIGPDPEILSGDEVKVFGIHKRNRPGLVTWAVQGSNLEDFAEAARSELIDLGAVAVGNRRQPDGRELTWQFTDPLAARMGGVLPFFIDWGDTPHPAASLSGDCRLLEFRLQHPHVGEVQKRLNFLGLEVRVEAAAEPRVLARIRTPGGDIDL